MPESKFVLLHDNTTTVIRILPILRDCYRACPTPNLDSHGKQIVRYLWPMVVRGKESEGVQILNVGVAVHKEILGYIINNRVFPKLTFWQKVRYNLAQWRPFKWLKVFGLKDDDMHYCSLPLSVLYSLFEWTPLNFVMRNPPPHDSVIELDTGYDLKISKTHQTTTGGYKLPLYRCDWIEKSKPAGTSQQIEAWKQEGELLFTKLNKEGHHGDEANKAGCSGSCS